jgi:hypothetical protein
VKNGRQWFETQSATRAQREEVGEEWHLLKQNFDEHPQRPLTSQVISVRSNEEPMRGHPLSTFFIHIAILSSLLSAAKRSLRMACLTTGSEDLAM